MNAAGTGISEQHLSEPGTADRGERLFEFLAEVQRLKSPPKLTTDRYEDTFWMSELPDHAAVRSASDLPDADPEVQVLVVDKIPRPADPPGVSPALKGWVDRPIDDPNSPPGLRQVFLDPADDDSNGSVHLADRPEVSGLFDSWLEEWSVWSAKIRADTPVRTLYKRLFATSELASTQNEEYELVIGMGQLDWTPDTQPHVSRHLLTYPAAITRDANTGAITIAPEPTAEPLEVELDMLDPSLTRGTAFSDVRADARQFDGHPLDSAQSGALVRRLVNALSPEAEYTDDVAKLSPRDAPRAAWAPAVILRKRTSRGLIKVFQDIAAEISSAGEVPDGLLPLLEPDYEPPTQSDPSDGAIVPGDDGEVLLPLPLNERQLEVVRRADVHAQTLVQGPPGTGKTHTAAALVTHLLAQGKRVLVTAHTDRALKEVRGKLPDAIKPLAVSLVGADRREMGNLKTAVNELSSRSSDHVPAESEQHIADLLDRIDQQRRERAKLRREVVSARATEVDSREHAGSAGTLAKIARTYQGHADSCNWIVEYATPAADAQAPITDAEAERWLNLVCDIDLTADEPEAAARLPEVSDIPNPDQFASLVDSEAVGAVGARAHASLQDHAAYEAVAALSAESRQHLRERMHRIAARASELEQHDESWMNAALHDIRSGRASRWEAMATVVAGLIAETNPFVQRLGPATEVTVLPTEDLGGLVNVARTMHQHLSNGGTIKTSADGLPKMGAFTNKTVKAGQTFFTSVRVDGRVPTSVDSVAAFLDYAEGNRLLGALDRAWPADVEIPEEDTLHERLQWHATELEQLHRLLTLGVSLDEEESHLRKVGMPRPDWNNIDAVLSYARLVDAATARDEHLRTARPLAHLESQLGAVTEWDDAADTAHAIARASSAKDRSGYAESHARLTRLHRVRELAAERDGLSARLRAAAPRLVDAVIAEPDAETWRDRIGSLATAWDWARTGAWLRAQESVDINVLHAQIDATERSLHSDVGELAATRAWSHAVAPTRLTGRSRADLSQYALLVRKLGKGTGKYAPRLRSEIRKSMDQCRPAVPVWIMPIYRITEQLQVRQNMFDVVIVDEASQAGLEAAFLQYLAPRIVVIGDDKQVSPIAVGANREPLHALANQYLSDNPYKATWERPDVSLFDLAAQRFRRITLVEHRRCVPEIIGFSNRIAYEPDNVRLIPVRQYGADRFHPISSVYLDDGYQQGSSSSRTNPTEVDAIVDQIQKCLADPAYDDRTFGVISLVGKRQAQQVQAKLLDIVSPEEWAARDLRCGDAADFQGSERDVMFLSMVSAPEEGRRLGAFVQELYVQRFNVAVSRAKDQLWLFHSLTLEDVPNPEDMRHQLIVYCKDVQSRLLGETPGSLAVSDDIRVERFDSLFEQRVYNRIIERGYLVEPQYDANGYRIDLVVTGGHARLAIECDGDAWHGPEQFERDVARQRDLERCGWTFFRIRESSWYTDQHAVLQGLWAVLDEHEIHHAGWRADDSDDPVTVPPEDTHPVAHVEAVVEPAPRVRPIGDAGVKHDDGTEAPVQVVAASASSTPTHRRLPQDHAAPLAELPEYDTFSGAVPSATESPRDDVVAALVEIVAVEGPITGARLHHAYLAASPYGRLGKEIVRALNSALSSALRRGLVEEDNPLNSSGYKNRTFSSTGQSSTRVRRLGPRSLDEVPPRELAELLRETADATAWDGLDALYRTVLNRLGRNRLTAQANETLNAVLPLAQEP